jgi:hypothetical protein
MEFGTWNFKNQADPWCSIQPVTKSKTKALVVTQKDKKEVNYGRNC